VLVEFDGALERIIGRADRVRGLAPTGFAGECAGRSFGAAMPRVAPGLVVVLPDLLNAGDGCAAADG
jgi:hypothetical protein